MSGMDYLSTKKIYIYIKKDIQGKKQIKEKYIKDR